MDPAIQVVHDEVGRYLDRFRAVRNQLLALRKEPYRSYDGFRYHANVKLHHVRLDLEKAFKACRVPKRFQEDARECFSSDFLDSRWSDLAQEARDELLFSLRNRKPFDPQPWDDIIRTETLALCGARGRARTKHRVRIEALELERAEQEKLHAAALIVDSDSLGFHGRSGGHFCFRTSCTDLDWAAAEILDQHVPCDLVENLERIQAQCTCEPLLLLQQARDRWTAWRKKRLIPHPCTHALERHFQGTISPRHLFELSAAITVEPMASVIFFLVGPQVVSCDDGPEEMLEQAERATRELAEEHALAKWLVTYVEDKARKLNFQGGLEVEVSDWLAQVREEAA